MSHDTPTAVVDSAARAPTVTEVLSTDRVQREIKRVAGAFAVVGAGLGTTGALLSWLFGGGGATSALYGATLGFVVLAVVLTSGVLLGAVTGFGVANRFEATARVRYVTAFVGNGLGYVLMGVVAALLLGSGGGSATTGGAAGGAVGLGGLLVPLLVLAVPVGLVGVGVVFVEGGATEGPRAG